jgi:hypothetical protein
LHSKKKSGRSLIVVIVCLQVARRGRSLLKLPCEIPTFYITSKKSKQLERGTVVQSEDIRRSVCKMVKLAAENSILYSRDHGKSCPALVVEAVSMVRKAMSQVQVYC